MTGNTKPMSVPMYYFIQVCVHIVCFFIYNICMEYMFQFAHVLNTLMYYFSTNTVRKVIVVNLNFITFILGDFCLHIKRALNCPFFFCLAYIHG